MDFHLHCPFLEAKVQSTCSAGSHFTPPPKVVDLCLTLHGDNKLLGDPLEAMQVLGFSLSLAHCI